MKDRIPISRKRQLDDLDDKEIVEGYLAGKSGWPEPGNNHSFAYWHGWRNGAVDGGFKEKDNHQTELARDFIA